MKSLQDKLVNIQFEHNLWFNELTFIIKEITIYEDRIMEIIDSYPGEVKETELGILLLGFIEQKEAAQQLIEQIREHIIHMNEKIRSNGHIKSIVNSVHYKTKKELAEFRKNHNRLKEKINNFESFKN